jgi:hypothetical protein
MGSYIEKEELEVITERVIKNTNTKFVLIGISTIVYYFFLIYR